MPRPFLRACALLLVSALLCHCRAPQPSPPPSPAALRLWHRANSRLAAATFLDRAGHPIPWRFSLRDTSGVNAQSWPDGRIQLTFGALSFAQNEAELAAVTAHEMAHIAARHGRAQTFDSAAALLASAALATLLSQSSDPTTASAAATAALFSVSLTALTARQREREFAADLASLDLLRRAHYPPSAAVHFWQRYAAARALQGLGKPHWWLPHPPDAERLRRLRLAASPAPAP